MGAIKDVKTGRVEILESEHVIGRRESDVTLSINERYISARHAVIRWSGGRWEVRDLGSRNGTFVDDVRLEPGTPTPLTLGSRLELAKQEQTWELVDDEPPRVMAVPMTGGAPVVATDQLLVLPSVDDPQVTIYRDSEGAWFLERSEQAAPIGNRQVFEVEKERRWRFCCPESLSRTSLAELTPAMEVRRLGLYFRVSRDEEHVELQVTWSGRTFNLGSRGHNYLLLTLARRRLADAAEAIPEGGCGWIYQEDLAHDPSMAPPQLNIDVFRVRQQFASIGVVDAANIIERRPRTKQLRIGTSDIVVTTL